MADALLEIDRISKRFRDVVALREMSFEVHPGELFGFIGPNGAGKTTTMRIALGVLAADSGEVRWKSRPITAAAQRRIGYLPEERGLYPRMRLLDQLIYLAELHGLSAGAARQRAEGWLDRLGLRAHRQDEVQQLSLGNQQRAQLAAALVHDPDLLILDEPFAGMDPTAVEVLGHVLREQAAAGVPVLFSSHQLDLVERLCDRVGVVQNGRMIASGTVTELRGGGPVTLVVDVPQAAQGWAAALPGCRVRAVDGTRTVLELASDTDDQLVLRAALDTGPVREFSRRRATLAELFRDVLANATPGRMP